MGRVSDRVGQGAGGRSRADESPYHPSDAKVYVCVYVYESVIAHRQSSSLSGPAASAGREAPSPAGLSSGTADGRAVFGLAGPRSARAPARAVPVTVGGKG